MSEHIKGITIEFDANTAGLKKAMTELDRNARKTSTALKDVNRALKLNPRSTTLLAQKQELLKRRVGEVSDKLKVMKMRLKEMDNDPSVDKTSADYKKLQRDIVKAEAYQKQFQKELRQFGTVGAQQVRAVGQAYQQAGQKIKSAGRSITTAISMYGIAGIYAGSKLIEMSQKQAQAEQKLSEIYKTRMGVDKKAVKSTLELASAQQKLGVVGDEVQIAGAQQLATYSKYPSTVNTLLPALNNLLVQQKGLNGTQEDATNLANMFGKAMMGQTGALKKAGITFTDAQAEILKTGNEEERAAILAEVVTQNVGNMNEAFAQTDAGKIQQAKNALGDMGEEIGAVLLPAVADLVSWLQANLMPKLQQMIDFFKQHPEIAKFALAFATITAVLGPVLVVIGSFVSAIGGILTIAPLVAGAIGAISLPVMAVVTAIGLAIAAGIAIVKNWDLIKAKAQAIWNNVQRAISIVTTRIKTNFTTMRTSVSNTWNALKTKVVSVANSIKNTVSTAFNTLKTKVSSVWNSIKTAITKPINSAKETVKNAVEKLKSFFPLKIGKIFSGLKVPHFSIKGGKAPFGIGGKGSKPSISVSWYRKAMENPYLFSDATLFGAGEAGDEILYGRNALMRDIAKASSGGGITINVYGSDNMSVSELAAEVERRLIQMQKRRTQAWA